MTGAVDVKLRAIVDSAPSGCSKHGESTFALCPGCTLEMLADLGNAGHAPALAVQARRIFGGLHALVHPAGGNAAGFADASAHCDTVRVPRGQYAIAAHGIADALARVADGLDLDGSRAASVEALTITADALGMNADSLLDLGRKRRAALTPQPPRPMPEPPRPPEPEQRAPDPTAGFRLVAPGEQVFPASLSKGPSLLGYLTSVVVLGGATAGLVVVGRALLGAVSGA